MEKQLKKSILTSYLIGAPTGILVIFFILTLPFMLTGEGLFSLVFFKIYGYSTIGLLLSFFIALFFGGAIAYQSVTNKDSLKITSFKYSLVVNVIIWFVFCLILFIQNLNDFTSFIIFLIPVIITFFISVLISVFTIGLIISSRIKKNYDK